MLTRLHIENLALVESLDLEFGAGLSLLTGETGAGKSILVEAVGLATGDRAETEMVRTGAQEAVVEAVFEPGNKAAEVNALLGAWGLDMEEQVVIRRRIQRTGRNTVTVNGAAVSLGQLRELGSHLVQVHGQHQSQSLLDEESHRRLLDALPEVAPSALDTASTQAVLSEALARLRSLQRSHAERDQRLDTIRFQRDEIDRVGPKAGEDEELSREKVRLQNVGRIVEGAAAVATLLRDGDPSSSSLASEAARHLQDLSEFDSAWIPFLKDLQQAAEILRAIASEAERTASTTVFDPGALELALQRLADLDRVKRKYGPALEDVLSHRDALEREYRLLSGDEADPAAAALKAEEAFQAYLASARRLSQARERAARSLAQSVEKELRPLALEKAHFLVELVPCPPAEPGQARPTGVEDVRFLFSANPGEPPKALAKIASGGELSRTLLALLTASRSGAGPGTLVFDEVDAGIGGKPAERVGRRLRDLASHHQVLCITHLPQIAAFAHHHYRVTKERRGQRTLIRTELLPGSARAEELARMIAGETVADTALQHARELLRAASQAAPGPEHS